MRPSVARFFRPLLPLLAMVIVGLAGCAGEERPSYASELDEPAFRQGQSLLKAGRRQEALTSFLRVIERRSEAPESHLEAGLLYLQHINDPLAAIYHFKKYLALRPNSPQAGLVKQRIDFAIREFAKTLPAQPLPSQFERIDLLAKIDRLQRENDDLKQQLADLKAGRSEGIRLPAAAGADAGPSETIATPFDLDTGGLPVVRTAPPPGRSPSDSPPVRLTSPARQPPPAAATARPTTTPAAATSAPATPVRGARSHVIRPGDTLYKLADQYYRDKARWRDIYAANRDVMKSETDLRVGMTLRIP